MSIIRLPLLYRTCETEKYLYTLFDSGADLSCVHPDQAAALGGVIALVRPRRVGTASEGHYIVVDSKVVLEFCINDVPLSDEFLVVPGLTEEAVIGAATMQKWRIRLDFEHDRVSVNPRLMRMRL